MLLEALGAMRDLGRVQEIVGVLIRYGFGDIVQRMGLTGLLERAGRMLPWHEPDATWREISPPQRVRQAMGELGPTFVKLGQVLATRVDLFGPEWIAEFSQLQNAVPALDFAQIREQLTEDLGRPPHEVFRRLEERALAAGSLGQVHRAELDDGTPVVLKVRRPGIRATIEADLRLLARLAEVLESEFPDWRRYQPGAVIRQFSASMQRELDFSEECRNAERIARNFADQPQIVVPRVYWEHVCERLNVQERIDGLPATQMQRLEELGLDRHELARRGIAAILKMVLEDGFFHADPHPGNLFFLADNRIALIDYGMVGRLGPRRRLEIARLLHGLASHEVEGVLDVLLGWSDHPELDEDRLQAEVDAFVDTYRSVPLQQLGFGRMLVDMTGVLRNNQLGLPPDLALMLKAFVTLEGVARSLDPDFDMAREAEPILRRQLLARYAPAGMARRGWQLASGTAELLAGLPRDVRQLLRMARRGRLRVEVEVTTLKAFGDQLDRAASRLTIGLVTSALIIGSAIVMNIRGPLGLSLSSALGLLGFVGAVIGGIWVLLSILAGRRR